MIFDCLLNVFRFLYIKDTNRCALVCKDWLCVFYSHLRLNQTDELLITWRHVHNIFLTGLKNKIVDNSNELSPVGFLTNLGLTIYTDGNNQNSIILKTYWDIFVRIQFPPKFEKDLHFVNLPMYQRVHDSFVLNFCDDSKLLIDLSNFLQNDTINVRELSQVDQVVFQSHSFDGIDIFNNHWTPHYQNYLIGGQERFRIIKKDDNGQTVWIRNVSDVKPFVDFDITPTTWYVIIEWFFVLFKYDCSHFWLINVEIPQQSGMIDFSLISPCVTFERFDKNIASWYKDGDMWLFDVEYFIGFQCCWNSQQKCWHVKKHSINCLQHWLMHAKIQCPTSNRVMPLK